MRITGLFLLLLTLSFQIQAASAAMFSMPENPWKEALAETVPTGSDPGGFTTEDFQIRWSTSPKDGLTVRLVPGSIEWSRVGNALLLPRVRIAVQVSGPGSDTSVLVRHTGKQALLVARPNGGWEGDLLVPLTRRNEIQIEYGNAWKHSFRIVYAPRDGRSHFFVDHTCSPFQIQGEIRSAEVPFWIWMGCHPVHGRSAEGRKQVIDRVLVTENASSEVGELLTSGGNELREVAPGVVEFSSEPARITRNFHLGRSVFTVSETASARIPYGSVGFGVGPYRYTLHSPLSSVDATTAIATLYGSYALTDTIRMTAFNATAMHRQLLTDGGIYFNSESIRAMDRRLSIHLMLGMNLIGARLGDQFKFKLNAPQGVEATWRDFLKRNHALSGGAFIYPKISDTAYYNIWIRYGKSGRFLELNYLNIRNQLAGVPFFAKAIGVSFGMPFFRFE